MYNPDTGNEAPNNAERKTRMRPGVPNIAPICIS